MEYRVGGEVLNVKGEILAKKLRMLFSDLKHRPRIYGYDIQLIRDDFELQLNSLDERQYILEIGFYNEKLKLLELLELLKGAFLSLELKFDIWYCEEDAEGNVLSDEVIFFDNHITSTQA